MPLAEAIRTGLNAGVCTAWGITNLWDLPMQRLKSAMRTNGALESTGPTTGKKSF